MGAIHRPLLLIAATLSSFVHGQNDTSGRNRTSVPATVWPTSLIGISEYPNETFSANFLATAVENPNATRITKFKPFRGFADDLGVRDIVWDWRVNITNYPAPNVTLARLAARPTPLDDPHVHAMSWDLSWPTDRETVTESLQGQDGVSSNVVRVGDFCATTLYGISTGFLPKTLNENYTAEQAKSSSPTDCAPVLGEACVNAMLASWDNKYPNPDFAGDAGCRYNGWPVPTECKHIHGDFPVELLMNNMTTNYNGTWDLETGGVAPKMKKRNWFWGFWGLPAEANDTTVYDDLVNAVQIFMLDPSLEVRKGDGNETEIVWGAKPQLLCTRVNVPGAEGNQIPAPEKGAAVSLRGSSGLAIAAVVAAVAWAL